MDSPYVVIIFCGKKELEIGYTKQFTRENLTFDDLFELKVIQKLGLVDIMFF